jgi:hypothetical protein
MMMNVEQSVEWEVAQETEVLGKNPAPVLLRPPQIPYDLTRARTRAAALGSQRLTAWAMERPLRSIKAGFELNRCGPRISVYGSTVLLLDLGRFFSFLILHKAGRTPWTEDQSAARPLPPHRTTQTQNKSTQTSMSWVGFEPTITASERAKTVHALDRTATVIGRVNEYLLVFSYEAGYKKYLWEWRGASKRSAW